MFAGPFLAMPSWRGLALTIAACAAVRIRGGKLCALGPIILGLCIFFYPLSARAVESYFRGVSPDYPPSIFAAKFLRTLKRASSPDFLGVPTVRAIDVVNIVVERDLRSVFLVCWRPFCHLLAPFR